MMGWFKKKEIVEKPKVEVSVKGTIKFDGVKEGLRDYVLAIEPDLKITYNWNGITGSFKRTYTMHVFVAPDYYGMNETILYEKAFDMIYNFKHQKEGNVIMEKIKGILEHDTVRHINKTKEEELEKRITDIAPQPIDISFKFEL